MNKYKYTAELIKEMPEGIQFQKTATFTSKKEWYGNVIGELVGRIFDNGKVESFLVHDDEQKNTEWFDKLREAGILESQHKNFINRETWEEYGCELYYLMRKVVGHSSEKPTVTDECLDTCINVRFEYTYEILLVSEELKRYVTNTIYTDGPHTYCLADAMERLEYLFDEWIDDKEKGFSRDEEGVIYVNFYDDFGEEYNAEFNSIRELLMCVQSVRIVELKRTVVDLSELNDDE